MENKKYLLDFREIFLKNEKVSELEMTSGNYDDEGKLIEGTIPTLTTEFCEIGVYNKTIYFVFIIHSDTYSKELFNVLKKFSNVKFYGSKDFNDTLYPKSDFQYEEFEEKIKQDKFLQIQFNYDIQEISAKLLYQEYKKIKKIFVEKQVKVVDQLGKMSL
ncbi:DUF3201 domain-containing protein [bacterium]|nr:MAG: DUF3201 domain-containing protein [bacterium]